MKKNVKRSGRPRLGKVRFAVTISPKGKELAEAMALQRGVSCGTVIEDLLWAEAEKEKQQSEGRPA